MPMHCTAPWQGHLVAQRGFARNSIRGLAHELIEKAKQSPQQLPQTPNVAESPLTAAAGVTSVSPAAAETGSPPAEAAAAAPAARVLEFEGSAAQPGDQSPSASASAPSRQASQALQAAAEAQSDGLPAEASREQLQCASGAADAGAATSNAPGHKAPAEEQQAELVEAAAAGQQPEGAWPQLLVAVAEEAALEPAQGKHASGGGRNKNQRSKWFRKVSAHPLLQQTTASAPHFPAAPELSPPEAAEGTGLSELPSLPPIWRPGERLLPPCDQQPSSPTGSVRSAASFASPLHAPWAALPHTIFRSSGIRPTPEDSIKREPRVGCYSCSPSATLCFSLLLIWC